ncbi:hypothetical protein HOU03_gp274 [Caulobacter phage CcrSC]|uniref:Restriction alleviation protein n=1 Tax=Caulobacter phage CcrSC TaxID=2283272 RepID=A0A385EDN2_9CAUD|nr:hypothetical protein HOU03_gp274 [Caulobacter phage CcrSC]AXQ69994.1 hypothetical protein CcrSC_gp412 [Caulobacter phage CcrSC]
MSDEAESKRLAEWGFYDALRYKAPSQDHPAYRAEYERMAGDMIDRLDPCKFCGAKMTVIEPNGEDWTGITCANPQCTGDVRIGLTDPDKHRRWVILAGAWNNRDMIG